MIHRALWHAQAANRLYPDIWRQIDAARGAGQWPAWCFIPISQLAPAVAADPYWVMNRRSDMATDIARLAALAAWRTTQTIYRFDDVLANLLCEPMADVRVPCEMLLMLPEWCIYVETPAISGLHGFFACCEWDERPGHGAELRLLLDRDDTLMPVALPLGHETIQGALAAIAGAAGRELAPTLAPIVSLLLYICSRTADIGAHRPLRPSTVSTKRGPRHFPPAAPTVVDVGVIVGAALRHAQARDTAPEGTGRTHSSPRAHWRRWHWHSYWVGAGAERRLELRWVPPVPVNVRAGDEMPAVIRPVG